MVLCISFLVTNPTTSIAMDKTTSTTLEIQIHLLVNAERAKNGNNIPVLQLQSNLIAVARAHSEDMLKNNFFDHINPIGQSPADRISAAGLKYVAVGENLFFGEGYTEDEIAKIAVDGWINSPEHYFNMLSFYRYTGIGIAKSGTVYYITQVFVDANKADMQSKGIIYDNSKLDQFKAEDKGRTIPRELIYLLIIIAVILIGKDAQRRNRKYR